MTRRFVFVRLPYLPTERFRKAWQQSARRQKPWWDEQASKDDEDPKPQKSPLVLVQHSVKGTRISAVGPEAQQEGLWPDMKLADARAMLPNLQVEQHDLAADATLFSRLARWMLRYSPSVAIYDDYCLVLDSTGCSHLFGGEYAMVHDIEQRLAAIGFSARVALADTVGAGFALTGFNKQSPYVLPAKASPDALDALPVDALRLKDETITLLKRLGLKRIGDARVLPRVALERRFRQTVKAAPKSQKSGLIQAVQLRLDQLSGAVAEPLTYICEPQPFRATKQCPELALELGSVGIALDELLPRLCKMLQDAGKGARYFRLTGYRADGGSSAVAASLSVPANKPAAIARLFKDRLEKIDCGFGIDLFTLEAAGVSAIHTGQHDMMKEHNEVLTSASIAGFADTITNRLGAPAVCRITPCESHVPERAQKPVAVTAPANWQAWQTTRPIWSPRPVRLLARPEPAQVTAELPDSPPAQFVWRKLLRKVIRARGPERILPEWWCDDLKAKQSAAYRDYYDVEDEHGLRYWLFRSARHEPVIAPDDEDESEPQTIMTTRWFVHGLF